MRLLVSPDGCEGAVVHPLDAPRPEHEGWHDCTDMADEDFDLFVTCLQLGL